MELERDGKIVVPPLPSKAIGRQVSFWAKDDGIFDQAFIEKRRQGLEDFINKYGGSTGVFVVCWMAMFTCVVIMQENCLLDGYGHMCCHDARES